MKGRTVVAYQEYHFSRRPGRKKGQLDYPYPLEEWTNGEEHVITRGTDFPEGADIIDVLLNAGKRMSKELVLKKVSARGEPTAYSIRYKEFD